MGSKEAAAIFSGLELVDMPDAEVTKNIEISGIKGNTLHFAVFHLTFDGKACSASIRIKGNGP